MSPILSYSHYVELLIQKDLNKVRYYIELVENNNLSVRKLRDRIKEESMMLEEIKLILLTVKGKYGIFFID